MAAVEGGAAIRRRLRIISKNVGRFIDDEMDDIAQEILAESRKLAPQDTGKMISTAGWDKDDTLESFRRSVFYKEDYAPIQHEGLIRGRPIQPGPGTRSKPGAGRKFLQRAYNAKVRDIPRRVGKAVERGLRVSLR